MEIIEAKDVCFNYSKYNGENLQDTNVKAIENLNITIEQGSFVSIVGENGSGKSTFAKMLAALEFPSAGTLYIDGNRIEKGNVPLNLCESLGMVFQDPDNQIISPVVEEDIGFGPENLGIQSEEILVRVHESLNDVGMMKYRYSDPSCLSGGQKQKIAIAGVLAMQPKCIVLDEPTAMLDPHGAGKSTLIKMLCGILHPTDGDISVLGVSPTKERRKLTMKIGSVFGQKSQLWMHLPPLDSFTLLVAMYEINKTDLKRRVEELTELFELGDFLRTPVRKLSLGQRIRCEVAASLLHEPELLFLDEPTIGLDVVVKQAIRELLYRRNKEHGTTIFLTSHDPADIEQLCHRAVVIDHGELVLDSSVETLKSDYLAKKLIDVSFSSLHTIPELEGVVVNSNSTGLRSSLTVDTNIKPIGEVMERISALGNVLDITINNPPMEDIIAAIFKQKENLL